MNIKKAVIFVVYIIVVLFLVLQSLLVLTTSVTKYKCFAVSSGSMAPFLKTGDLIITEPVNFDDIKTGDVLTFSDKKNDMFFTHRVIEINAEKQWLYTKGDANSVKDPTPTSYDYVAGRLVVSLKYLGYIHLLINSVYSAIIISVLIILMILQKVYYFNKIKKQNE